MLTLQCRALFPESTVELGASEEKLLLNLT